MHGLERERKRLHLGCFVTVEDFMSARQGVNIFLSENKSLARAPVFNEGAAAAK